MAGSGGEVTARAGVRAIEASGGEVMAKAGVRAIEASGGEVGVHAFDASGEDR